MITTLHGYRAGVVLLFLLSASSCTGTPDSAPYVDDTPEQLATEPTVGEVRFPRDGRMVVYPAEDTYWKQLVDLHLFGSLRPGISLADVREKWGEPDSGGERLLSTYWTYNRESGQVEIALAEVGSPPFPYSKKWFLNGKPARSRPSDLLHQSVLEHLPSEEPAELELTIMNKPAQSEGNGPSVILDIDNGKVTRLTWLR